MFFDLPKDVRLRIWNIARFSHAHNVLIDFLPKRKQWKAQPYSYRGIFPAHISTYHQLTYNKVMILSELLQPIAGCERDYSITKDLPRIQLGMIVGWNGRVKIYFKLSIIETRQMKKVSNDVWQITHQNGVPIVFSAFAHLTDISCTAQYR